MQLQKKLWSGNKANGRHGWSDLRRRLIEPLEPRAYLNGVAFSTVTSFPTAAYPDSVAAADFNADGNADLVTANFGDGTLSVLLGNGDGTFRPRADYVVGNGPESAVLADVNHDGRLDILVANSGSNPADTLHADADTISVLLGNGDGTFQPAVNFGVGHGPQSVTVADFNGDGQPDLLVTNRLDNTVSISLGTGLGTFGPATPFATGIRPMSAAVADLNGDGKQDVVVANEGSGTVNVFLGSGDGHLQPLVVYHTGERPRFVVVTDASHDGIADIVTANYVHSSLSVLLGIGNGLFHSRTDYAPGASPFAVAVADLNGDNHPDLISADQNADSVSVHLMFRNGAFQSNVNFPTGSGPQSLAVADVNNDGHPDIITADFNSSSVGVLINKLQSSVTTLVTSENPAPGGARVQLSAVVAVATGSSFPPRGNVEFFDGATSLGISSVKAGGVASLIVSKLAVGSHTITAQYYGDTHSAGSGALLPAQTIIPRQTSGALLVPIVASMGPVAIPAGKVARVSLLIDNQGASAANGVLAVQLLLSSDTTISPDDTVLSIPALANLRIRLGAAGARRVNAKVMIPAGVVPGGYHLLARLVGISGFGASDLSADSSASPGTITIAP